MPPSSSSPPSSPPRILAPGVLLRRVAREGRAARDVDALVLAEDGFLVLSGDPEPRDPGPALRVHTAALEAEPLPVGSLVERRGVPVRVLAVVHDLARDPSWTEEGIRATFVEILRLAARRGWRSLACESLGARHGRADPDRVEALLEEAVAEVGPPALREIRLLPPG